MTTLYPTQRANALHLHKALMEYGAAIDASDTGTGKTYTACGVASMMGGALVVCPKSVVPTWERVSAETGCSVQAVTYEKLRTGNTGFVSKQGKKKFVWNLEPGSLVIFDEAHRCGGYDSQLSVLCAMTRAYRLKSLLLSATLADNPLKLRAAGYLLGLHRFQDCYRWLLQNGCRKGFFGGIEPPSEKNLPKYMNRIHATIFPEKGVRVRSADMPEFPETLIRAEAYAVPDWKEIDAKCRELQKLVEDATEGSALTLQLRLRQEIEYLKLPVFIELVSDALEEGMRVAVFVSFRLTLDALNGHFKDAARVDGSMPVPDRAREIARFQGDEAKVFLCTISAGGSGISLHDMDGDKPRMALISPSFNAVEMRQVFGRVHRAGGRSKSIQRIVYASGTVEERVAKRLNAKLAAMEAFNDGDLMI